MSQLAYSMGTIRATSARWGASVAVVVAAFDVWGVYGDSKAPASQRDSLPVIVAAVLVVTAIVFGLLVPAGMRAIEQRTATASRWALGHAIAAVVALVVFWSGLPLILGSAAVLLAVTGLRSQPATKQLTIARGLGIVAIVVAVVVSILGNVLHN